MTSLETDQLALLIEQKLACLTELYGMSQEQLALARDGKMTALLEVLAMKQQKIGRLQQIERAIAPFRHESPEDRHWSTPEARQRCADQLDQCETLLADLLALEKEGESQLTLRRDEAAQRLQHSHLAAAARGMYRQSAPRGASQLDLASDQ
ncbi:MAG: hypothetical protein JW818_08950 [Pirellulales bacterium]|nr:hypothetical protein [Pirellulales bacterium]